MTKNLTPFLLFSLLFMASTVFLSCKKPETQNDYSSAHITLELRSKGLPVIPDSLSNTNAAGNTYSVRMVNLYLSNFSLKREDGFVYTSDKIFYIDPAIPSKSSLRLESIPKGTYREVTFLVGIDSARNTDLGLPSTTDNLNMAWPTAMGGGYHFIKIEGHFLDSSNTPRGYAVHLGRNENLIKIKATSQLFQHSELHRHSLLFDINEVFANPHLYDLNADKTYTMSDSAAMSIIKRNIQHDAFTLIQNN